MSIFDQLDQGITTRSISETNAVATALAQALPIDSILTLRGDLGAGKTTFVKALALALGVKGPIKSPTYNIFSIHQGTIQLVHMDAYRLSGPNAIEELMLEEFLQSPYCLVIEWPERIIDWLPSATIALSLSIQDEHTRLIQTDLTTNFQQSE